jgi:hypothetical protein
VRVLSLDISTSTGWASIDTDVGPPSLQYGTIVLPKRARDYASHPWGYFLAAKELAKLLLARVEAQPIDVLVVEETNGARARFTQKVLEYCHFAFLDAFFAQPVGRGLVKLVYLNTSEWRKVTDTKMTKEDKNRNAKLSRHKRNASIKGSKLDKKALGISGKTTIKHVAIRRVQELYGLELLAKDDDIADAILLVHAYINGAKPCTGNDKV